MPFSVAVLDEAGYDRLDAEYATRLCAVAFSSQGFDVERVGEVSVAIVEPEAIRNLNLRFRRKNEPTDVLSFVLDGPYGEMVGEVVICPACASPQMGVEELVAHGALHLSGMDHGEDFEGSEMARTQQAIMRAVREAEG
jgi:probable rRNA maturation factor